MTQEVGLAEDLSHVMSAFEEVRRPARAKNILQITGRESGGYSVYHDCRRLASDRSTDGALAAAVAGLNSAAVDQCRMLAAHSGVVAWRDGVVALPAESGHGKTTLTAALVQLGFDYLSDEALVFDDDGAVVPYPKPFALSEWSAETLGIPSNGKETMATAQDLSGKVGDGGPLTDLILFEYGHEDLSIDPLPKSQAVAALIKYSFNHYKNPERAFRIVTDVARDVRVWRLEYDDPTEAAELIAATLH